MGAIQIKIEKRFVEVVRCKDCKHWKDKTCYDTIIPNPQPDGEWFCADGQKKDGGDNAE